MKCLAVPSAWFSSLEELLGQELHVVASLPQRRKLDREDVQAVVQVLAQLAGRDRLLDAAAGGGDDAHVDLDRLGSADAGDRGRLQRPQQPDLDVDGLGDLVEKQGPSVGALEVPLVHPVGAGEAAALVAEQLALDQVRGQGPAVHGKERFLAAAAQVVDRLGDQLLAGAGLAADQDAGVGPGHAADQVVDLLHGRATRRSAAPNRPSLRSSPRSVPISPLISRARVTLPRAILTRAKSTGFVR